MLRGSSGSPDILISFRRSDGRFEMPPGGLFLGWVYISFQFSLADIPSRTFPRPGVRPSAGKIKKAAPMGGELTRFSAV